MLVKVSRLFVTGAAKQLQMMVDAVHTLDAQLLRRAAHTLKSSAAQIGAYGLSELCRELELRAEAGEMDDAARRIDQCSAAYQRLCNTIERIIEEEEATSM